MSRVSRVRPLERSVSDKTFVLYLDFGNDEYIKQVNGVNEYLSKKEFDLETENIKTIEIR